MILHISCRVRCFYRHFITEFMKQSLFLLSFILCAGVPASARVALSANPGVTYASDANIIRLPSHLEDIFKTFYRGYPITLKRTQANKLPRKGGTEIASVEQFLAARFSTMNGNNAVPLLSLELETEFKAAIDLLTIILPSWSRTIYLDEMAFYREEDTRRQLAKKQEEEQLARSQAEMEQKRLKQKEEQLARLQAETEQQRLKQQEEARRDSLFRLASSVERANQVDESQIESDPPPAVQTALSAQLYKTLLRMKEEDRLSAAKKGSAPVKKGVSQKRLVKAKPATGPTAYYCTSGNTVKYHTYSTCRGLTRCGSSVAKIRLAEAQQSMEACKWCN